MTSREEAAQAILGAILLSGPVLSTVTEEHVRPGHFAASSDRDVYEAMLALADRDDPVDPLTVTAELERRNTPGAAAKVNALAGAVPDLGNVRGYCTILREHAWFDHAQRAMYAAAEAVERRDRDGVLAALANLDPPTRTADVDTGTEFMSWYENDRAGIPLPFAELTEAVGGGFQAGETTMLGGWPAMGKSLFATQILLDAVHAGASCHEYANEMNGPRRTARLLSTVTGIPVAKIAKRSLTSDEWGKVLQVLNRLPFETTPTAGWPVEDYARDIRRRRPDVAVVDTVTNLPCSKVDEWDRACGLLNDAAAQSGTHLVLICQLNLERDKGAIKPPPTGRDLRNTGAWYQRSRIVMFVHRDQAMVQVGEAEIPQVLTDGHIRVDKATHGEPARGFVAVSFNPRWMRFDRTSDYQIGAVA